MAAIIQTPDDIARGVAALCALDDRMARLHGLCGQPPLRRQQGGLEGLAWIIVSQQVSVASARAIWARTHQVFTPFTADRLRTAPDADFRAGGLSAPKIRTLRAVAEALAGGFDLDGLGDLPADEAHKRLTAVKGIGPWTADIYLLFCLGHADAFAAGDLALQEAARLAFDLDARPPAAALAGLAEAWRPWRGVAARLLWAYYARVKWGREGAPVQG